MIMVFNLRMNFFLGWTNEKYAHMCMQRFSLNSPQPPSKVKKKKKKRKKEKKEKKDSCKYFGDRLQWCEIVCLVVACKAGVLRVMHRG